jgi:hypothetical protein
VDHVHKVDETARSDDWDPSNGYETWPAH